MRMIFIIFHFLHELLLLPLPFPFTLPSSLPCFPCLGDAGFTIQKVLLGLRKTQTRRHIYLCMVFVLRKMLINQDVIRFMPMRRLNDVGMLIYRLFLVVKN